MRKQFLAVVASTAALVLVTGSSHAQSSAPWVGTWKVNLEKSTFSPGPKPTVAAEVKIEPAPNGMKTTIDAVNPQGEKTHTETLAAFDGKDYPVKGGPNPNATSTLKRIDDRSFESQGKVSGKPTVTTRIVISKDGKTLTATQTGTNVQGQAVKNVIVAERQ
ncbi:MAG TPA: hypothetical protein VGF24_36515 [Vicinamibacterales bacterium]|jgi:hypothetical protein